MAAPQRPVAGSPRPASRRVHPTAPGRQAGSSRLVPAAQRSSAVHFSMRTPEGDRGYHTAEDEAQSEGSEPEQDEPLDGRGRLMQQFDYEEALHSRVGFSAGGASTARRAEQAQSGQVGVPQAAGRDAPPWQQASLDPSMTLQMQIQYEMLRQMRALGASAASRDDAPDADALDGLRVSRSLGRMRSLRETMEQNPERTYREYKDQWVGKLGAEGRAFRWTDRNKSIRLQVQLGSQMRLDALPHLGDARAWRRSAGKGADSAVLEEPA